MAIDNSPAQRQQRKLERKVNRRAPYQRVLIVTEGSKTEPGYFSEIRSKYRLNSAWVCIQPSTEGTNPLNVVNCAKQLFLDGVGGGAMKSPRAFDVVYVVFDRDEHLHYDEALQAAQELALKNDFNKSVPCIAVPSSPCFEFWLLLHYQKLSKLLHRKKVLHRLKTHLPEYEKGMPALFLRASAFLDIACTRAHDVNRQSNPRHSSLAYTEVVTLVERLIHLKD